MTKETGGMAFPLETSIGFSAGMTLRDWFAGQALNGMLAFPHKINGNTNILRISCARLAYETANAMLEARN